MIPRVPGVYEWGYEDPASGNKVVAFYLGKAMNLQVRFSRYASSGSRRLVFPKETKSKVANNKREAFRDLQIQGYQLVYRCDALQHLMCDSVHRNSARQAYGCTGMVAPAPCPLHLLPPPLHPCTPGLLLPVLLGHTQTTVHLWCACAQSLHLVPYACGALSPLLYQTA